MKRAEIERRFPIGSQHRIKVRHGGQSREYQGKIVDYGLFWYASSESDPWLIVLDEGNGVQGYLLVNPDHIEESEPPASLE